MKVSWEEPPAAVFCFQTGTRGAQELSSHPPSREPLSPKQLAQLLDRYARPLSLFACQWTSQPDDAVQEAWIELAGQIPPPPDPVAWLFRVVKHRALNASRSSRRRREREQIAARPESDRKTPAGLVEQAEQHQRLLAALDTLPAGDRELVVLRLWSSLGWESIGELTGLSRSSAHRHYQQALHQLKLQLDPVTPTSTNPKQRTSPS